MRFITFSEGAGLRRSPGVLLDDLSTVVDLSPHYATLQDLIDAGDAGRSKAESVVASSAGRLRPAAADLLAPPPGLRHFPRVTVYEDPAPTATAEGHRRRANRRARPHTPPTSTPHPPHKPSTP